MSDRLLVAFQVTTKSLIPTTHSEPSYQDTHKHAELCALVWWETAKEQHKRPKNVPLPKRRGRRRAPFKGISIKREISSFGTTTSYPLLYRDGTKNTFRQGSPQPKKQCWLPKKKKKGIHLLLMIVSLLFHALLFFPRSIFWLLSYGKVFFSFYIVGVENETKNKKQNKKRRRISWVPFKLQPSTITKSRSFSYKHFATEKIIS